MADTETPIDLTPEEFRRLGHDLIDRIATVLGGIRERPVAPDTDSRTLRRRIGEAAMPETGCDPAADLEHLTELLFANTCLSAHPRMWGYITGSPSPLGALADLLAAAANPNVAGWNGAPLATEIETQTIEKISNLVGFSSYCGGILTSGGNMANMTALLAARRAKLGPQVRRQGIAGRRLAVYATGETHAWVDKAVDLMGLGTDAIRRVASDGAQRMATDDLERRIARDREDGVEPLAVIGSAGTTATGAVDPLPAIARICRAHDLWFHVDGCYGAPAVLSTDAPNDLAGMAEADSLAVDAHKWLFAPLEAGCTLVRDGRWLTETFATQPSYYGMAGSHGEGVIDYYAMGPQNSRGFRALKVWLTLRQMGRSGYVTTISRNMAQARAMFDTLAAQDDFEAVTCRLSIATFRYVPRDLAGRRDEPDVAAYLDRLNAALMVRVQRSGDLYLSNALVDGRQLLRACIVNFRTTDEDVDSVPDRVRRLAEPLDREMRAR